MNKQQDLSVPAREIKLAHFVNTVIAEKCLPTYLPSDSSADPCSSSSSTCQNGGTCVSSNTDPPVSSCLCPEGFTGRYCEQPMENNPCASNPCQTRGYCALSSSNQSFICVCQENFIGEQCERSNPCSSSPCLNQGICQANWNRTDTWFTCRCVGTYTGQRCETSMLNPCGGLCMNG